jgi:hypothetical protein
MGWVRVYIVSDGHFTVCVRAWWPQDKGAEGEGDEIDVAAEFAAARKEDQDKKKKKDVFVPASRVTGVCRMGWVADMLVAPMNREC